MRINYKPQQANASLRMNKAEYIALREYMHTADEENVKFPYGVQIIKRGFGWYFMAPEGNNRKEDKMTFALKVLRRFIKDEEEKIEDEIKKLMPTVLSSVDLRVAAFTGNEFSYVSERHAATTATPAPIHKLQQLAAHFSKGY
jgi:hypothetical protein